MVWCNKDYVITDVHFDKDWFAQRFDHLEKFYFMNLLPALADSILSKELKIVKPFVV